MLRAERAPGLSRSARRLRVAAGSIVARRPSTKLEREREPGVSSSTSTRSEKHVGQEVTLRGWLYNMRESGKLLFPIFRDGTGMIQGVVSLKEQPEAFEALRGLTQESSVIVTGVIRAEQRAPGGFEIGVTQVEIVQRVAGIRSLSDPAQRARRRFSARPPPSLDSHAAPGRHPAHPRRSHSRRARIHGRPGLHAHRRADLHAGGLRRHHHAL